jgi:PAS domain S-box-containing protein
MEPFANGAAAQGAKSEPARGPVLVVEDEPTIRLLLRELLHHSGYSIEVVETGEGALAALDQNEFGVAIVDKNLPDVNGLDIVQRMRVVTPLTRAIVYTGYPSQDSAIEALRAGAFDYMIKPAHNAMVLEKVQRAWTAYANDLERQELLRQYETLFEIVPGIVWFMTDDGIIRRINAEGAALLGYTAAELCGKSYDRLVAPGPSEAEAWALRERRTGDRAGRRRVIELCCKDGGKRVFEVSATGTYDRSAAFPNKRFSGTLGVGWDITTRQALEGHLHQARRMEAIGRVAGAVAHDFNNYLSVIINAATFLADAIPQDDVRYNDVAQIDRAATQAAVLTKRLLALSRRTRVQAQALDVRKVIADIEPLLRRMVTENITLSVEVADAIGLVKADIGQIEQVLVNLVANARDALPTGGKLTVSACDAFVAPELAAQHFGLRPGQHVRLRVADDGVGMDEETRAHIFDAFFTTKEPGKGTGLGLATVYQIVTGCGGCISVDSAQGKGTTVTIYLPHTDERAAAAQHETKAAQGSGTVLLVEDDLMVREVAQRILTQNGYRVVTAAAAEEALVHAQSERGPFAAVVTDVVLPGLNGLMLAERLRADRPGLPVVYISGHIEEQLTEAPSTDGNARFVRKPFTASGLLLPLQELLTKRDR